MLERILTLIKISQKSETALEKEMGLSQGQIKHWRNGRNKISMDAIIKIAKYFGVSTDYLLGLTDNPTIFTDTDRAGDISEHGKVTVAPDELELLGLYNSIGYKFGKARQATIIKLLTAMANEEKI